MIQFILVLMLVTNISSEIINPSVDQCICYMIKSETDCETISTCAWTAEIDATAGSCGTWTTVPISTAYCPQVTEPSTNCWKTLGCAYVDSKCTHFTGCTAYVKTTNFDCQAISSLCITDGTQCTDSQSCNQYTEEAQCTGNPSISGIKICKWDNSACRDYVCTEADITLATDAECSSWLQGCVTTGKGCTLTLGACASYAGDEVTCSGLKGTDGNCEGTVGGTNCITRVCSKAMATVVTDIDCQAYQVGCITNGKGCVSSPLPACATFLGDNITCIGYIGSDGICEGDSGATNCRSRVCTNAPASNDTNDLCNAFKVGCVTTGKGCATSKTACSGYSGTSTSCVGYIGTDGYCKGIDNATSQPCEAKVCSDAPTTASTDADCILYQLGCKSTGKGCVATLGLCSSYSGTNTACGGFIGSDGKCKGTLTIITTCDVSLSLDGTCTGTLTDTVGPCSPKLCTEAPTSTTTNEACALYQFGCVTTGSGCVAPTDCLATIKSLACTGTVGCGWNSICVASQNCSDFQTISICNGNNAILVSGGTSITTPCFWTGSACRNLACTDAPQMLITDTQCNFFLKGCWTKGNGCLDPSAPCSSYLGNKDTCSSFTRQCYNVEGASSTTACTEKLCNDDITSTLDSSCNSFKTGCLTKGTGCIDPSKLCSDYSGIQQVCDAFRGNNGLTRCWSLSTTVSSACIDKTCAHKVSASSNSDCDAFLSGCLFNGVGCVTKSQPCSAYTGTLSQCNLYRANNGVDTCWNVSTTISASCVVKNCGHAGALTSDADCKIFLESCLTTGSGCISKTAPCSSYTGTLTVCEAFTGNSIKCYNKDACTDRLCTDKASGVANNAECTTYLGSCRYFNGGCVTQNICTGYPGNTLANCQDVFDNSSTPQKCWWITGGTTCIARTCANAPTVSNQQGCTDHLDICIFNGSICLNQGICASYTVNGTDLMEKQINCGAMRDDSNSQYCWNNGADICEDRTCMNVPSPTSKQSCDNHIGDSTSCWWNGSGCVSSNICSNYTPTGTSDSIKLTICQAMNDTSGTLITCYFVPGTLNCVSKSCSNVFTPTSQSSCDIHLYGQCGWNGIACVELGNCNSYTPTGDTETAKRTICEALRNINSTPIKCTFISGVSTCVERTCQNVISPTSNNDCTQWLVSCQWNGKYCESTSVCSNYTPFGINQVFRTSICGSLKDSAISPTLCTQSTYTAPLACSARVCSSITSPKGLIDCTNFSLTCRWPGIGSCVQATDCTSYSVIGNTGAAQCAALTDTSGAVCGYVSGVTCSVSVCSYKKNATNQADCDIQGIYCRYVGVGTCEIAVPCTYSVSSIIGNQARKSVCENAIDTTGTIFCTYLPGSDLCIPRGGCQGYYASSFEVCSAIVNTAGIACNYTSSTTCRESICSDKIDATSQADCTNYLSQCRYVGVGICLTAADCDYDVSTVGSDLAKKTLCDNLTNSLHVKCTFVPQATACSARKTCYDYQGTSIEICNKIVDINGNLCSFTGGIICSVGTCGQKIDAANLTDCKIQGDWCRYVGDTTCVTASACTGYSITGIDSFKLSLCNQLTDVGGLSCTWVSQTASTCVARDCTNIISPISNLDCKSWVNSCTFTGFNCITIAACQDYIPIGLDNLSKRSHCSAILDNSPTPLLCGYRDNAANCETRSCTNGGLLTSHQACKAWLNTCTYNGVSCLIATTCDLYTLTSLSNATTDSAQYDQCRALTDGKDNGCDIILPKCQVRTCANITPPPTKYSDCTNWQSTCRFTGNICVPASACTYTLTGDYASVTKSNQDKIDFCKGLEDNTDSTPKIYCTLTTPIASGTLCVPRTCSNVDPTPTSYDNCTNWLSSCTYNGITCVTTTTCESYTLTGNDDATRETQCRSLKNTSGNLCGFVTGANQTNCIDRVCGNAPSPSSDNDCSTYKINCTISYAPSALCLDSTSDCTLFFGLPAQCQSFTGNSLKCWSYEGASTSSPQACKLRECTDNTTSTTNDECTTFLEGCKTSGMGCVLNNINCSTFLGNNTTCNTFKASDGTNFCKVGVTSSNACKVRACTDNASFTTDSQCNSFIPGCLTNGKGCIASTEPCTKYQGTQSTCAGYTGNGKKCWNPSSVTIVTTYCVDKKCSDDTVSTTDIACNSSLTGCVTKGTGCIEKTAACGSYQGTQPICSAFFGNSGTKPCWNVVQASLTTPCVEKACIHNTTSTSDIDCETFIPRPDEATIPLCVTNGTGCVDYPRACSSLTGTLEECGSFTASDGPCKTMATGSISASGTCTPRICSEALNSNNTDALCQVFHPICITNGYGCTSSISCLEIQEQNSCGAKTGCSWVQNCRSIGTDCSSLTTSSASICVNTPVSSGSKKCSWYNGTTCRAQTCEDLPATFISHTSCSGALSTCTTTGSGCITVSSCSAYLSEIICKTAKTSDIGDTCIWDIGSPISNSTNACRVKKCTDAPAGTSTNVLCQAYLTGCKTNGASCMENVTCPALLTASACQVDGNGNPCLFVNGLCNSFSKCEDILMNTHSACQIFSPLCTTNGQNCIAITTCAKTINLISCVVGTDGTCGWLPANGAILAQCQSFGACSDAIAIDMASCSAYGSNCITDGTKCIDKSACSTYITQVACESNGTDGVCQFIQSSTSCRLRECTDATATNTSGGITTHSGCNAFIAKDKCTTNGTTCIAFQDCAQYTVKEGCVEGLDGLCVYIIPTTSDFGTCQLMNACSDANHDEAACIANSLACNWLVSETTTACNAHTCSTRSLGSTCIPVPNFDLKTYTICGPSSYGCTEVSGSNLLSTTCQLYTLNTFTWDETSTECIACFTNFSDPGQQVRTSTTADGILIYSIVTLIILAMIVV